MVCEIQRSRITSRMVKDEVKIVDQQDKDRMPFHMVRLCVTSRCGPRRSQSGGLQFRTTWSMANGIEKNFSIHQILKHLDLFKEVRSTHSRENMGHLTNETLWGISRSFKGN